MPTKTTLKAVGWTLVTIWALNQFDQTKDLLNGRTGFFG